MAYKTCKECGCKIYNLGCVNCNEIDYIDEQSYFEKEETRINGEHTKREEYKRRNY